MGIQLEKAKVGLTSGPTWHLSHSGGGHAATDPALSRPVGRCAGCGGCGGGGAHPGERPRLLEGAIGHEEGRAAWDSVALSFQK